jgi:Kdo2-lipid IVA lauroyltransferase/acyltransferase
MAATWMMWRVRARFCIMAGVNSVWQWLQYAALWTALKTAGLLPRRAARAGCALGAATVFAFLPRLRRAAMFNLALAFPDWTDEQRRAAIRGMVRQLGWMAGEFSQFPRYARASREKMREIVALDGLENFLAGERAGKGVLILTGHMGAWELAPFAQARFGHPLHFLAREVDNLWVDKLINSYRTMTGNEPIEKNQAARTTLRILHEGGTVGILADQNTLPEEGVFVDFFGVAACTTTGIARLALHTGALVVPGYIFWDAKQGRYVLRFEPAVELTRTGDLDRDIAENTQRFAKAIENYARRYPDQWLWVHKRWKTRPAGDKPLYPF